MTFGLPQRKPNMIRFPNGHVLTFANGSGALAFNGKGWWWEQPLRWLGVLDPKAFTVVAKTVTRHPKVGNLSMWHPWTCVRLVPWGHGGGAVNAIGLTNAGIDHWAIKDYPVAKSMGYKIAASVKADTIEDAEYMARVLQSLDLAYVEVNMSCPNVHNLHDILDSRRMLEAWRRCGHPVVLKLSESQVAEEFVLKTSSLVDAYHAINTIPWPDIMEGPSPIAKYPHKQNGGVSGAPIFERAVHAVMRLRIMTDKPIIGGGGIMSTRDVSFFANAGADAFSIGTLFLRAPWKPNQIVREYLKG